MSETLWDTVLAILKEHLSNDVQEGLWRLRAKRAWIREQIQAQRGFPEDDADYAEPWSDALGEPVLHSHYDS